MTSSTHGHDRDLWIDAVRVAAVSVVVVGHWLTTTVIWEDGVIDIENALSVIREAHVATWLIQVMPLMFFVGGFSNSRSLDLHGGSFLPYLRTRYTRLLRPTLVFIGLWTAISLIADVAGLPLPNIVDRAADLAALPFWFLGLYLFVVALAPPMLRLHHRFGRSVVATLVAGALLVDIAHHGFGIPHIGVLNYAFVWLLAHQLGFFYAEGQTPGRRGLATATVAGLVGLVALTAVVRYPVSMVGVPGDERWNTNPPSLALVMLTFWLAGLALLLRPTALRCLSRDRWQRLVATLNGSLLTVFLWHVTALAVTGAVLYSVGFPRPTTGTVAWWALRPVWIAAVSPVLWWLVVALRRFEVHPRPHRDIATGANRLYVAAATVAIVSTGLGILGFGVTGFNRITAGLGEGVLGIELNPLMNLTHLILGLAMLASLYRRPGWTRGVWTFELAVFLSLGLAGRPDGLSLFGTNPATALLHMTLAAVGLVLYVWSFRPEDSR